jgi:TPR repeat protein
MRRAFAGLACFTAVSVSLVLVGVLESRAATDDYADPRRKAALVIALGAYRNASPLKNPVSDLNVVAPRLKAAGFAVTEVKNAALPELQQAIAAFLAAAKGSDIALVYYAGHAVQIDSENYIVPVDFDAAQADIIAQLYPIGALIKDLAGAAKARVLLLDACRDNPFATRLKAALPGRAIGIGLAPINIETVDGRGLPEGTHGLLVGYATQPQTTASDGSGANGPYARALGEALANADAEFNSILQRASRSVLAETAGRQHPEYRHALTGPLYLVSRPKPLLCDVLAAEPDNDVSVKGIEFEEIDVAKALPACEADLARFPASPRLMHNYGRTLERAGRLEEAIGLYRRAAELGNDWAQYYLATVNMEGTGTPYNMKEGVYWLRRSFEQGNRQALVSYTELDLTQIFDEKPWRVKILQNALRKAGYAGVTDSGEMDEETRGALEKLMRTYSLESKAITFQLLDRLAIVEQLFPKTPPDEN